MPLLLRANVSLSFKFPQTTLPDVPASGYAFVSAINGFSSTANCSLTVCASPAGQCHFLAPNGTLTNLDRERPEMFNLPAATETQFQIAFEAGSNGDNSGCPSGNWTATREFGSGKTFWMLVTDQGVIFGEANPNKPRQGTGEFSVG